MQGAIWECQVGFYYFLLLVYHMFTTFYDFCNKNTKIHKHKTWRTVSCGFPGFPGVPQGPFSEGSEGWRRLRRVEEG